LFLLIRLLFVLLSLTGLKGKELLDWIQMPAGLDAFLQRPWTALTYMFVHYDLMHLFMNMLWLYFFGKMSLRWYSERQLGAHYVLGGLTGALFFLFGYEYLPFFSGLQIQSPLIGASASVMALCIAVTVYSPDEPVSLFMLGNLKLKYLALVMIVLDLLGFNEANAGVGLAHFGGAVWGLIAGLSMRRGKDLAAWLNPLISLCSKRSANRPSKRSRMHVSYQRSTKETTFRSADVDKSYLDKKKREAAKLDAILDKVKQSGYDSLSQDEKKQLFDFSDRTN
ncbi:MAG: rhomboid family intramembrane serine protease, partial [Bacteroidota bacterium]|nr:rhomboid family intramembrane serine protease [Bacteroidota bacterium]